MQKISRAMSVETKKQLLIGLYVAFMLIVNTVGTKIMSIAGVRASVGILYLPFLFIISDTISEAFGKEEAKRMANISTFLLLLLVISFYVCISLPPHPGWEYQKEYRTIFNQSVRMSAASVIAFFISQRMDIDIFSKLRKKTSGKRLYVRNVVSTAVSLAADTILFMFLAFYRMSDKYTVGFVFSLIWPYYLLKLAFTFISAPLCYLGVWWCKRGRTEIPQGFAKGSYAGAESDADAAGGSDASHVVGDSGSGPVVLPGAVESADFGVAGEFSDGDVSGYSGDNGMSAAAVNGDDGDDDDDEDDEEWARKWRLANGMAEKTSDESLSDGNATQDVRVPTETYDAGGSEGDLSFAGQNAENYDFGAIGADSHQLSDEQHSETDYSQLSDVVEVATAEQFPGLEEDLVEKEKREALERLLKQNIPGIAFFGSDGRPEVTMEFDDDMETYEDEPDPVAFDGISRETDEFDNPNIAIHDTVMMDIDAAIAVADKRLREEGFDKDCDYQEDDSEIEKWWDDFEMDPDSFLSINQVNTSYRVEDEEFKKELRARIRRNKGESESKGDRKKSIFGKPKRHNRSSDAVLDAFEPARDAYSAADSTISLPDENPNEAAFDGFALVGDLRIPKSASDDDGAGEQDYDDSEIDKWWDDFEYDAEDVLDWSAVNLSYRSAGKTRGKTYNENSNFERNGIEQTAPDWALGEWYVDEGDFGLQRVATFRRNCYINQNDEDIGLIEYNTIGDNAALEYYVVKRTDTDFSVEQHDGDFDLIAYYLKKTKDGFKIALSVLGKEVSESDFRPAIKKEDGSRA